jgi:hypothetical protein
VLHAIGLRVVARLRDEEIPDDLRHRLIVAVVDWAMARGA